MRTATVPETAVLDSTHYRASTRVEVKNGSGTWKDYSDWVDTIRLDWEIDQPVGQLTLDLLRDDDRPGGGIGSKRSLAPFRTDSALNVNDAGAYAPAIDVARDIRVYVATTEPWRAPVTADWKLLFLGAIDKIAWHQSPVQLVARDEGGALIDKWIESPGSHGSAAGVALETVMQEILTTWASGVTLHTPVSPSFLVAPKYRQQVASVMDALRELANKKAWDVRYKWDAGTSSFRLTLYEPPRTKTVPDATIGPSRILEIVQLEVDRTPIRNKIRVRHPANLTGVFAADTASQTKYGLRWMEIIEPQDSPINTDAEAQTLADLALADLKDPKAEQEIEMHFDWRVELHDLLRLSPNGRWYNTDQDLAVARVSHELSRDRHRTRVHVRGKPAGQYLTWIAKSRGLLRPTGRSFDDRGRIESQERLSVVDIGSKSSVQDLDANLTAVDLAGAGTGVRIDVSEHTVRYTFASVIYAAGSVTVSLYSTPYFVYVEDHTFEGGAVTYIATANAQELAAVPGRYYVGRVTTPSDGGANTTGGGGAGAGGNKLRVV